MPRNLVPLMPKTQTMDRDAETDQIKEELETSRARYALYRRIGGVMKVFFMASILLFAIGALVLAIKSFVLHELSGVYFVYALLIFVFGFAIIRLIRSSDLRWIDVASQPFRGIYSPNFFYPDTDVRRARSHAELIEWQIADRERRLSELGESLSGSNKID